MKEETTITVNWVSNGIDCCCVGFLPCAFVVQGSVWDGVLCQVVEVFQKDNPTKLCRAKWHQNKGFERIAVIGTSDLPLGLLQKTELLDNSITLADFTRRAPRRTGNDGPRHDYEKDRRWA
jgi:hypothetical protein